MIRARHRLRLGKIEPGKHIVNLQMKPYGPKEVAEAFLLIDWVNNVNKLAEEQNSVLRRVRDIVANMDASTLKRDVQRYGGVRAKKLFASLDETTVTHAA